MSYRQITEEERYKIAAMRGMGLGPVVIARELGRDRRTISREVARNCSVHDGAYRAMAACEKARARKTRSRRNKRYGPEEFEGVERMLREDFSPEQVVGRLRLEGARPMSHETIYQWIWADKRATVSKLWILKPGVENAQMGEGVG
jgi:IS30 family transposase